MFGFSAGEILFIALIALLLFGNEKLPQNIKKFFHGWNQTKKTALDLQRSWHEIKLDLKENLDFEEEKKLLTGLNQDLASSNIKTPIVAKPLAQIVSQDEIDAHQNEITHETQQNPLDPTTKLPYPIHSTPKINEA